MWLLSLLFTGIVLICAGCTTSDRPLTAPVRGQVTYRGRPVAGATVSFLCPGAPRPAIGTTDASGNYVLTTFEPNDGAVVGTHVVTVRQFSTDIGTSRVPVPADQDGEAMADAIGQAMQQTARQLQDSERAGAQLLPPKYADRKTSDLRKEVRSGDNTVDIELVE
jgi:hypothetical protein